MEGDVLFFGLDKKKKKLTHKVKVDSKSILFFSR